MDDKEVTARRSAGGGVHVGPVLSTEWTQAKRRKFFENLAATCNVRWSAEQAGMKPRSAYSLRDRDGDFAAGWAAALDVSRLRIETMLLARAGGTGIVAEFDAGAHEDVTEGLDTELALKLLAGHRLAMNGGTRRRRGHAPRRATTEELNATILKNLSALNKRLGGAG